MRTTKGQVESLFAILAAKAGKRVARSYNDVGAWALDYAAPYGGYVIEEISNDAGGISHPAGESRRAAGEMWSAMHFALRVLEASEG